MREQLKVANWGIKISAPNFGGNNNATFYAEHHNKTDNNKKRERNTKKSIETVKRTAFYCPPIAKKFEFELTPTTTIHVYECLS